VYLFAPVPGEYLIRVRATRVVEDARRDTAVRDQDFALVVSAAFGTPGVGIVTFNQPIYRAPDLIRLVLVDYDLAGQPSVNLTVRSGVEPAGEIVTLSAHGVSGLFTGAVATATSPGSGQLQIAHGNVIEAVYADAAPPASRVFTALADLQPPIITNVSATNQFGQIVVSWNTDEDARAVVYFGTNTPNVALTNAAFDVEHQLPLPDFPDGAVIRYFAVAQDMAGNRATNNNSGSFFTITNVRPPAVFLLDSYTDSGGFIAAPPLSGYTDTLHLRLPPSGGGGGAGDDPSGRRWGGGHDGHLPPSSGRGGAGDGHGGRRWGGGHDGHLPPSGPGGGAGDGPGFRWWCGSHGG
jgi:hypothetical protein